MGFDVLGGQWDHCSSPKLPLLALLFVWGLWQWGGREGQHEMEKSLAGNCWQMPSLERQDSSRDALGKQQNFNAGA